MVISCTPNISSFLFIYFSRLKKTCECRRRIQKRCFSSLHKIWFSNAMLATFNSKWIRCLDEAQTGFLFLFSESSNWFHTADWNTNTLWTLVRDSRCNCGLDTVMSAIFHHWASSYCDMTAALTLPPEQDSLLAQTLVGDRVEKSLCATG